MYIILVKCLKVSIRGSYSLAPHVIVRDQLACQLLVLNHHLAVTTNLQTRGLTTYSILIIEDGLIQQQSSLLRRWVSLFHWLAIARPIRRDCLCAGIYIIHVKCLYTGKTCLYVLYVTGTCTCYIQVSTCLCTIIYLFMYGFLPIYVAGIYLLCTGSTCLCTGIYLFMCGQLYYLCTGIN